jgi:mannose-6-phosphate isomerase-like protein (cupin superfamily)
MNISLAKKAKRVIQKRCHNGRGTILFREVFSKKDFRSTIQFLHETSVMPNSTIGYHKHSGNEEIYYVIEGKGLMVVDGEERIIGPGDAVITYSGSSHGLKNIGDKNLKILVFEAKY